MLRVLVFLGAVALAAADCGKPAITPDLTPAINIVGGKKAIEGSWPWMVQVIKNDGHWCGGTLLNEQWVVSAAHCFEKTPDLFRYQFSVGAHKADALYEDTRQTRFASKIIRHENYRDLLYKYDVALIKLDGPVTMWDKASPACLQPQDKKPAAGTNAYVTGWGSQETIIRKQELQQAMVPIISNAKCEESYPRQIHETMICAGYEQGGKDACQGDSGGPMVVQDSKGVWSLVGITSWGNGCADAGFYGVYADVSELNNWITTTMAKN